MSCEQMLRARQAPITHLMPITSAFLITETRNSG